jgi:hypothetical protein
MFGLTRPFAKRDSPEPAQTSPVVDHWLVFITLLPTEDPSGRMKVLRTFESLGCGMLRDGVYLLPETKDHLASFKRLAEYVTSIGGTAHTLRVSGGDPDQDNLFRTLFDRSESYLELAKTIESLRAGFGISTPSSIARVLERQREAFEQLGTIDYFGTQARAVTARVLAETERAVSTMLVTDTSKLVARGGPRREFFRKTWVTRVPLTPDRAASAWLIRRFIDAEANLVWLTKLEALPEGAVSYGFEGAQFAASRARINFEEMLRAFQLQKNGALVRLGILVRSIDTGDISIAEAAGAETLLEAARRRAVADADYFAEAERIFDMLFDKYDATAGKSPVQVGLAERNPTLRLSKSSHD